MDHNQWSKKLAKLEAHCSLLLNAMPDLLAWIRPDGTIAKLSVGKDFKDGFGGSFTGDRIQTLLSETNRSCLDFILQAMEMRCIAQRECELAFSGKVQYVDVRVVPIETDIMVVIFRDISARRQLEEQISQFQEQLAHVAGLSMMDGEMVVAAIIHEINQPLTAISNYTCACIRLFDLGVNREELLDGLKQAAAHAEHAGEVVRRLRAFLSYRHLRRSSVDVNDIVREALNLYAATIEKKATIARLELTNPLPPVFADRIQIMQVLVNLMRNAIEAMDESSSSELRIQTFIDASEVTVAVIDRGSGIPPNMVEKIFKPFETTKAEGTGLGLAISRAIIDAHGGRLWAKRNSDRGSTFCFTIPVSEKT